MVKWSLSKKEEKKGRQAFTSQIDNNLMHPVALEGHYQEIFKMGIELWTLYNLQLWGEVKK